MAARLRTIFVFLVLGAMLNFAVLMACIWFGRVDGLGRSSLLYSSRSLAWDRSESRGLTLLLWSVREQIAPPDHPLIPSWSRLRGETLPRRAPENDAIVVTHELGAGWPRRAMAFECDLHLTPSMANRWVYISGLELPARQDDPTNPFELQPRAIPTRIIPAGLAVNTLAYGAFAWLACITPRLFRRAWRQARGCCLACGYSRSGLAAGAVCPECGGAAGRTKRET